MEIIRGTHNVRPRHQGCVATIGNFDGVHHGHQNLLSHLVAKSRELAVPSVLITFEPLPREFFRGAAMPARLTRLREKVVLLQRTNLDRLLLLPFNEQLAQVSARAVIDGFLVGLLGVKYVVVGDDFRFGRGREGDYAMLKAAGDVNGFGVSHLGTLTFDHARVSSTRIRELLAQGKFDVAERLLGHEYFIMGRVVYGRQLGRTLGVPTANIRLNRYKAPVAGVFVVRVEGLDREYDGVANVGVRPTLGGKEWLLEVHLFDFAGDVYGKHLCVSFRQKLRDEQAFDSLEELKAQIGRDMLAARAWLATDGARHGANERNEPHVAL
jgi:riboflavin kinase/FMN adenylyltransferase